MTGVKAVLFDVDGTLAETEEVHRLSFNDTFRQFGLDWTWDQNLYRRLLKVAGGKERMRHYSDERSMSLTDATIVEMHGVKTRRYVDLVETGRCPLRPGVEAAIRGARGYGLRLAIATTTSHANVGALLAANLGPEGRGFFDVYLLALERLNLDPSDCLAIEDSANGVAAARAAGLKAWVTPSHYMAHENFEGAARSCRALKISAVCSQTDKRKSRRRASASGSLVRNA